MSKWDTVTLHHVIKVYNDMFDHMDVVMRASAKKKIPWMEDMFLAVKLARQKLSKYYAQVTPTMGMLRISTHLLNSLRKLKSFRKWDKGIDLNPEDHTSYTTHHQEAFLQYVENEYCAKHLRVPVNKYESLLGSNLIPSATASGFLQSSFDPYDLSSDGEGHMMANNGAETTPG